jgi:hypothetical protein
VLFRDTLKDIYFAEKKILSTLPKMAKAAQADELRAAFENMKKRPGRGIGEGRARGDFDLRKPSPRARVAPAMMPKNSALAKCKAEDPSAVGGGRGSFWDVRAEPSFFRQSRGRRNVPKRVLLIVGPLCQPEAALPKCGATTGADSSRPR